MVADQGDEHLAVMVGGILWTNAVTASSQRMSSGFWESGSCRQMLSGGLPAQFGSSLVALERASVTSWLKRWRGSQGSVVRRPTIQVVPPPGWLSRPASWDPARGGGVGVAADSNHISATVVLPHELREGRPLVSLPCRARAWPGAPRPGR